MIVRLYQCPFSIAETGIGYSTIRGTGSMQLVRRMKPRAFTLIELLVVVAIITLLIAVLIPSLANAKNKARQVRCATNMRQWGVAGYNYMTQNNGLLPAKGGDGQPKGLSNPTGPVGNWNDMSLWFNALPSQMNGSQAYSDLQTADRNLGGGLKFAGRLPAGGASSIYICPSVGMVQGAYSVQAPNQQQGADEVWVGGSAQPSGEGPFFEVYGSSTISPNGSDGRPFLICYQWNSKMVTNPPNGTITSPDDPFINNACRLLTSVETSQSLIMMSEKRCRADEIPPGDPENIVAQTIDPSYYNYALYPLCQPKGAWQRFTTRHSDGGNLLYIDGHVEYAKYKDVVTPRVLPAGGNNNIGDWNNPPKWLWNPTYIAN
jgi:prepilin-type N-terminal cleavage/methylation domain-containing protein/prepilin-type processing-associated H-X9-DG protein